MLKTRGARIPESDASAAGFDPARLARIRPWMQDYVDTGRLPGALTLVARRGAMVWCDWVGQRDVERDLPWTRDTLIRIYSMTKPITATALMMLFEQGLCRLDDPVDLYIPEFAGRTVLRPDARSIDDVDPARTRLTLHHLLTHTSGLTYGFQEGLLAEAYRSDGVDFSDQSATLATTVSRLARLPLGFEPGSRWNYSVSTDVIGRIVEVISGRSLDQVLRQDILGPLGMDDTFFAVPEAKLDRLASLYSRPPIDALSLPLGAICRIANQDIGPGYR